ncbi:hypothetical protein MPSEU_000921400 [Mayamaea pseudoterrestris]|nr:hypothetical protein MPSEU_000921400 [Mayamaea pseudoterrestris]
MTRVKFLKRRRSQSTYRWFFAALFLVALIVGCAVYTQLGINVDAPLLFNVNMFPYSPFTKHETPPIVIAYAISLIQCGDHQSNAAGMTDAAAVLAHSIHQHSSRNKHNTKNSQLTASGGRYDYKLYAIVHEQAVECSQLLENIGYQRIIVPAPFQLDDINDLVLRRTMRNAWCCGHNEFVKLHAYNITDHPLVVHLDVDFLMTKPMDDLFDLMLHNVRHDYANDTILENMRRNVPRETNSWVNPPNHWPENIQAAFTRDWPQMRPGRRPGFQAGFIVLKPNETMFHDIVHTILNTPYVEDFSRQNGWGAAGYGMYVGAAAMQGLLAYYYDTFHNDSWIELNQCQFNHMGMDLRWRDLPNAPASTGHPQYGTCRNGMKECEDCQHTPVEHIYSIHYTQCRKPWNCIGQGTGEFPTDPMAIPENNVILTHCMELQRVWHDYRSDLEQQLLTLQSNDGNVHAANAISKGQSGNYMRDVFQGHCTSNGGQGYMPIGGHDSVIMRRIPELYR